MLQKPEEIIDQAVNSLPGIGAQTAKRLDKLGISKIQDLLFHLPLRYEDRTRVHAIGSLKAGMNVLVCGRIELVDIITRGRRSLICRITDDTGFLSLRFFHFTAKQQMSLRTGTLISCFSEVRNGYTGLEMIHPEYNVISTPDACITELCLTPVYPLTEGLRQKPLRKAIQQALMLCKTNGQLLVDWLPAPILKQLDYPDLSEAIQTLHAPDNSISAEALQNGCLPALKRLAFEEFLAHHLCRQLARIKIRNCKAPVFKIDQDLQNNFFQALNFTLTQAQQRVIKEIKVDCYIATPMMRLLQGDVGSGKTVVSAFAALLAVSTGYQVAIMAPTELLAEQHYLSFSAWFRPLQVQVGFLSGQLKGKQRQEILNAIEEGSTGIIVGTHALFQESVKFSRLGLIIIDEQHRFGVNQRLALRDKAQQPDINPHQLVMTATPIPRTLAMLQYSDLDISILDELPPGRKPVITRVIPATRRTEIIDRIKHWVSQNQQAYWVCTLIEESELLQCEAAEQTQLKLAQALPDLRIALIHGRMKSAEKEQLMLEFKQQKIDLLVATTVIEVGVDVPNASLMIIENSERLGLSQLHQLRGRVGRGTADSYCLLMYQMPLAQASRERLAILRSTTDGFAIAEKDLALRGPGEMMGTRQTGQIQFKIANIARDSELLEQVHRAAKIILSEHPDVIQPLINRWLGESTHFAEV